VGEIFLLASISGVVYLRKISLPVKWEQLQQQPQQ